MGVKIWVTPWFNSYCRPSPTLPELALVPCHAPLHAVFCWCSNLDLRIGPLTKHATGCYGPCVGVQHGLSAMSCIT